MDYAKWANQEIKKVAEPKRKTELKAIIAKRLGIALSTLHARLRNDGAKFDTDEVEIMAEVIGVESPARNKRGHTNNVVSLPRPARFAGKDWVTYPVQGVANAGTFSEADLLAQVDPYDVLGPRNPDHPNATPMAWIAQGNSMNEKKIFDGSILIGVDFNEAGGVLRNDDIVVVERNRGGLIERSVKAVAVFPDRTEFQPRSTDPRHKPIIVYKSGNHDDGVTVRILTVVYDSLNSLRN